MQNPSDNLVPSSEALLPSSCEAIAGGLAERGFAVIEQFLSSQAVAELRAVLIDSYRRGAFHKAAVGTGSSLRIDAATRGDFVLWLDPDIPHAPLQKFFATLEALRSYLNHTCFLSLRSYEVHFALYPPGTGYKRHLDQTRGSSRRRVTFILYLNDDWLPEHGGQLRMYLREDDGQETAHDITPFGGTFVVFRSDLIEHEVLPATRERFSLTGWFLDQILW